MILNAPPVLTGSLLFAVVGVAGELGPPWPSWVSVPANLAVVAFLLWALYTGQLIRRADFDAALLKEQQAAASQIASAVQLSAERSDAAVMLAGERVAGLRGQLELQESRIGLITADRDAWREAHNEEVHARRAAERAATQLLEGTTVTTRLLTALENVLAGRGIASSG